MKNKYYRIDRVIAEKFDGSEKQAHEWGLKKLPYDKKSNDWYINFEQIDPLEIGCYLVKDENEVFWCTENYFKKHYIKEN